MIYFNECDVLINGSGLLFDSVLLSTQNSILPVYVLGNKGVISQTSSGPLKTNIQVSYLLEVGNEPIYGIVSGIKNSHSNFNNNNFILNIGGLTGYVYLESYGVRVEPNDLVKAVASFVSYEPISGYFTGSIGSTSYNLTKGSGLGHSWSTDLFFRDSSVVDPIYGFDYSFKINWLPVFVLGNKNQVQMHFLGAEESMSFIKENYSGATISGDNAVYLLKNIDKIRLNSFSNILKSSKNAPTTSFSAPNIQTSGLDFIISGMIVTSTQLSENVGDFVKSTVNCQKFY